MAKKKPASPRKPKTTKPTGPKKHPFAKRAQEPVWTWDSGLTFSAMSAWLECPEQFGVKYIDGLTSKGFSIPLEFGSLFHYCQETQFKFPSPQQCAEQTCNEYQAFRSKTLQNSAEMDSLALITGLVRVTFPRYCKFWKADDDRIEWIMRESKFRVPYNLPNGVTIDLRGMCDGVFRLGGKLGIFETKTKSKISEDEIVSGLRADTQTLIYAIATREETGETPTQVEYNIVRRTGLKKRVGDTLFDYLQRVAEDIDDRPDHYFTRYEVTLLPGDIETFERQTLQPTLIDIHRWWEGVKKNPMGKGRFDYPYHRLNTNALVGKYGKADVWEVLVQGNKRNFRVRSEPFPELSDLFQGTL